MGRVSVHKRPVVSTLFAETQPGMVVHAYDPCTQEAGEYHIWLASLGCTVRPFSSDVMMVVAGEMAEQLGRTGVGFPVAMLGRSDNLWPLRILNSVKCTYPYADTYS